MSTPNQAPYYRPYRPRSIFGPLVLITVGIVFLLWNMGWLPHQSFRLWYAHYWPLLLIVWGVARLVEHFWAKQKGEPVPRTGGGAVVFLVFFVMFSSVVTSSANWNWSGIGSDLNIDPDIDIGFFGNRYDFTDNFAQSLSGGTQIKILSTQGDIAVTASEDNQAHVVAHKTLRSDSQDSANHLNESTRPKFTQMGNVWVLDLTSGDYEHGRFNLDVQLPRQLALSLSTHRGNLSVAQRDGNVELSTDHGSVTAEQVKGDALLRVRSGSANIKDITGNVQVEGEVEDSNVSGVGGTLDFNAGYNGDVQLSRIGQRLHFKSVRTDLQLPKLDGEITMRHGDFRASSVTGPLKLNTRSNDVHLEDVSGSVEVENRNGLVELRTKAPLGNIDINNVHGGIQVDMPSASNFQLDAQSMGGNIESDFSVNVDNRGRDATAQGTVGKGGNVVRLKADRGTIQIHKQQ